MMTGIFLKIQKMKHGWKFTFTL